MQSKPSIFLSLRVFVHLGLGLVLLVGLGVVMGGLARPAHAATTITVSACDESHLDAAITQANSDNANDTINFSCSGDITLTSTLGISGSMILDGSGQSVTLDGGNSVRVLSVNGGVTFTLNALTIAHGNASCFECGGGLTNDGTVSISNSTFANNSATGTFGEGGGLANHFGTMTISKSTFANNSSTGLGGGLMNFPPSTMTISNSTFANNSAGHGGGLENDGTMTITNSTFATNSASLTGGGLYNGNTVSITNSTFANNSAGATAGGIYNDGGTPATTVNVGESIVANNAGGNCAKNFPGTITSTGYNLESGTDCGFTGTGDLQNSDPKLASALASNGGPTQTLALRDGSPAINHIPTSACAATTDQRGITRPQGPACDIGAFEFRVPKLNLPSTITVDATSPQGASVTYTVTASEPDDASATPTVSCTPASGSTFPIGSTTVNCTASDAASPPDTTSGSFQVVVKSAAAQISDLISLVNSFHLARNLQTALDNKLQDVLTAINAGQTATACSELTDFIGFVQSHTGKGITQSQATQLIAAAKQVQAVLGC